jgi:hypothetical protein
MSVINVWKSAVEEKMKHPNPFNSDEIKSIQAVIKYAEEHRFSKADLYAIMAGAIGCPGDDPYMACHLNNGLRMAFSYEEHPMGWCRHLSISDSNNPRKSVTPDIVEIVMKEFGFVGTLHDTVKVWFEDAWLPTIGDVKAVNIIQPENLIREEPAKKEV